MKEVQAALKDIGIPVLAGVWRATSPDQNPPSQYVVYSSTTTESSHADDQVTSYRTFVYLNLWSKFDPTEMRDKIRKAMYVYGFAIREESGNHTAPIPLLLTTYCLFSLSASDNRIAASLPLIKQSTSINIASIQILKVRIEGTTELSPPTLQYAETGICIACTVRSATRHCLSNRISIILDNGIGHLLHKTASLSISKTFRGLIQG